MFLGQQSSFNAVHFGARGFPSEQFLPRRLLAFLHFKLRHRPSSIHATPSKTSRPFRGAVPRHAQTRLRRTPAIGPAQTAITPSPAENSRPGWRFAASPNRLPQTGRIHKGLHTQPRPAPTDPNEATGDGRAV